MKVHQKEVKNKVTIGQRKTFYSPCNIWKQCKENHESYQNNVWISHKNKELKPVQPVQMNIYTSNTFRKDFFRLHFHDDPSVQERQLVKDKQSNIPVSEAYPTYLLSLRSQNTGFVSNRVSLTLQGKSQGIVLFHQPIFNPSLPLRLVKSESESLIS